MSDFDAVSAERLHLADGLQLFAESEREWLVLARRGSIHPENLAERASRLLAPRLDVADDDDIVLTVDCIGMDWEAHVELTKKGVTGKGERVVETVLSTLPNRFEE